VLPRFDVVARRRPIHLVAPASAATATGPGTQPLPQPAPYVAVEAEIDGPAVLTLTSGDVRLAARFDGVYADLAVTTGGRTTTHRSRRFARPGEPVAALALTLTGTHLTAFTRAATGAAGMGADASADETTDPDAWTARARFDLSERLDCHDEAWLAGLSATTEGAVATWRAGGFGQLGLRDVRQVTHADGSTYRLDEERDGGLDGRAGGRLLLTATSAGPGFFDTAHTSVWALEPATLGLEHRADLFFRRPDRPGAFGDHATHLVRDGDRWLVATSTWGDFDRGRPRVEVTLAETDADLTVGRHLLDTRALALPTRREGPAPLDLRSVGVWDPHLVRTETEEGPRWLVGFVSATSFFRFHPALAVGPTLDDLTLRAGAVERTATEGTTLLEVDGQWRVLASDGRDGSRGQRERYPVFDLDLREIGRLDAPYPTNIPWPTLIRDGDSWLWVTFDGRASAGRLPGYGTHGDLLVLRPEGR